VIVECPVECIGDPPPPRVAVRVLLYVRKFRCALRLCIQRRSDDERLVFCGRFFARRAADSLGSLIGVSFRRKYAFFL
jgi:hypothetical protein